MFVARRSVTSPRAPRSAPRMRTSSGMSISEAPVDLERALELVPALSLLNEDARRLVWASFEPRSYGFGDVIVAEGEEADAFYVLVNGTVRVVKRSDAGDEVSLNV